MESSRNLFMSIVTAGILGTTAGAWAAPGLGGGPGYCDGPMAGMGMRGAKFDRIDPSARAEQRLARLHADLKVTSEQEPLWQAFAEKTKAEAGKGWQTMRDTAQDLSLSAPERMTRMTDVMKQRVAAMESVNESFKRLYDALSPDQKRVADIHAARMGGAGRMHGHRGPMQGMGGMGGGMGPRGGMPPAPPTNN
jgi:phage-related minor tail protein